MKYVEAPDEFTTDTKSLFLAGGITGCPNWQHQVVSKLLFTDVVLFNPRRLNFPIEDPTASLKQVDWEHRYLRKATAVSFWFPSETLCPIVLYELGAWSMTDKPLFIGVDPEYKRKNDVVIQTSLVRENIEIVYSINDLTNLIKTWAGA